MGTVEGYLTSNEEVKLRWQGGLKSSNETNSRGFSDQLGGGSTGQTTFAATTKRLLLLDGDRFKDIDNTHISSVEVDKTTEPDLTPIQWVAMLGLLVAGAGLIALLSGEFGFGLFSLILGGGAFGGSWMVVDQPSQLFDFREKTTYEVKVITGDEAHQEIEFETEENIGTELSRIVREYS